MVLQTERAELAGEVTGQSSTLLSGRVESITTLSVQESVRDKLAQGG